MKNRSKFQLIRDHILICCSGVSPDVEMSRCDEVSILEQTISDIIEDSEAKDKFLDRVVQDKNRSLQEALCIESDLTKLIAEQKSTILYLELELSDLKKSMNEKLIAKPLCDRETQTTNVFKKDQAIQVEKSSTRENACQTNSIHNNNVSCQTDCQTDFIPTEEESYKNNSMKGTNVATQTKIPKICSETHVVHAMVHVDAHSEETLTRSRDKPNTSGKNLENSERTGLNNKQSSHDRLKKRLLILSDEYGKYLREKLVRGGDLRDYHVESIVKPGASLQLVIEDMESLVRDFTNSDYVFVLAGKNDLDLDRKPLFKFIASKIKNCCHTNIVFMSVPMFRLTKNAFHITKFNNYLAKLMERANLCYATTISFLEVNNFRGLKLTNSKITRRMSKILFANGNHGGGTYNNTYHQVNSAVNNVHVSLRVDRGDSSEHLQDDLITISDTVNSSSVSLNDGPDAESPAVDLLNSGFNLGNNTNTNDPSLSYDYDFLCPRFCLASPLSQSIRLVS